MPSTDNAAVNKRAEEALKLFFSAIGST